MQALDGLGVIAAIASPVTGAVGSVRTLSQCHVVNFFKKTVKSLLNCRRMLKRLKTQELSINKHWCKQTTLTIKRCMKLLS
jgi:hypothetical protein